MSYHVTMLYNVLCVLFLTYYWGVLENLVLFWLARLHYCCQLLYHLERINDDGEHG